MPDNPVDTQQQQLPEFRKSPNFRELYSNSVNIDITPWEFKFTFGRILKQEPGQTRSIVENIVEITASPQLAKAFLSLLQAHMRDYEKNVGEVKLPMQPSQTSAP